STHGLPKLNSATLTGSIPPCKGNFEAGIKSTKQAPAVGVARQDTSDKLLFIRVKILNKTVDALVDSGAQVNVVSRKLASLVHARLRKTESSVTAALADGTTVLKSSHTLPAAKLHIEGTPMQSLEDFL